ncbi:MAG: hypothetical protein IJZ79_02275 [Bacilli bacterium]|nr:hypothetical protein [Bacilli bacterium]
MNNNHNKLILFREVDGKQRPFIDINFISETINVPKDVLIYHISENENLISLKDYVNYGKLIAKHVGIRTIIYLTQCFNKDITLWQNIIEMMYESANTDNIDNKYQSLCKSLRELCNTHNIDIESSEDIDTDEDIEVDENELETNKKKTYRKNSKYLPTLTEEETTWQRNAVDKAREKAKARNSTLSATLRIIYSKMTNVYGIVFDQEKKDIRNMFNIDEDEHMSTLYVVTVSAQLRSLFECILADL